MSRVHAMLRPTQKDGLEDTEEGWSSDPLAVKPPAATPDGNNRYEEDYVYDTSDPEAAKKLGYNPSKAIILPRPIGWISTYPSSPSSSSSSPSSSSSSENDKDRIQHLAPFSFFAQIAKDPPLVAFASWRTEDGTRKKDAQLDAETTGCFGVNTVTPELAVPMNYTSATVGRDGDEFAVAGLERRCRAATVDAPVVKESPLSMECSYVKTVAVGGFSLVVGRVRRVRIAKSIMAPTPQQQTKKKSKSLLDLTKLRPVTRLGYPDEYGVIDEYL